MSNGAVGEVKLGQECTFVIWVWYGHGLHKYASFQLEGPMIGLQRYGSEGPGGSKPLSGRPAQRRQRSARAVGRIPSCRRVGLNLNYAKWRQFCSSGPYFKLLGR